LFKEAEYTFTVGKPFVPLILQENYKPDGWLGLILGAKMFVNFKKYSFEECSKRLQSELSKLSLSSDESFKKISVQQTSAVPNKIQAVDNWSVADVQNWLVKNNTNEKIRGVLENFDGQMLSDLNSIRLTAPDYFYDAISKNNTIDLFAVVKFNREFKALFQ
jgi:small nuclear ribonucleoprotein (snRNP)-like protein